jgi:hypothetical protein
MTTSEVGSLSGIFAKPPKMMADYFSSREIFSGGPAEGLRLLAVYMAYAGKRLSPSRRHSLEQARELLLRRTQQK